MKLKQKGMKKMKTLELLPNTDGERAARLIQIEEFWYRQDAKCNKRSRLQLTKNSMRAKFIPLQTLIEY